MPICSGGLPPELDAARGSLPLASLAWSQLSEILSPWGGGGKVLRLCLHFSGGRSCSSSQVVTDSRTFSLRGVNI